MVDMLYRIVPLEEWHITRREGQVPRGGADERDGFVHLSTADTYLETANLYFEPDEVPVALEIDPSALGEAKKRRPGQSLTPRVERARAMDKEPLRDLRWQVARTGYRSAACRVQSRSRRSGWLR